MGNHLRDSFVPGQGHVLGYMKNTIKCGEFLDWSRNYIVASPEGLCSMALVTALRCMFNSGSMQGLSVEKIARERNCQISF
jgi:hypothetical protein